MLTLSRRPAIKVMTDPTPPAVVPAVVPGPHRQRFTVEVAFYRSPAEVADCLASPVSGRRVVLFGGDGPLPAETGDRVLRLAGADPFKVAVIAFAGLAAGDTLTVLLPDGWTGPAPEALLDHARRWFSSPHSSEDEQVG